MLESILDKLHADERVSGWQVREVERSSRQMFLNKDREESRRQVGSLTYEVEILLNHPALKDGKSRPATGQSRFVTDRGSYGRFDQDLTQALFAAGFVDNDPYRMPDPGPSFPKLELCDTGLRDKPEETLDSLSERLRSALAGEKGVRLAAGEFFADHFRIRHMNSQGLQAAQESTLLSGEAALLASRPGGESEVFKAFRRRRLQDLPIEKEAARWAESGRARALASLPQTGNFDVVFSGEALDHFFGWFLTQAAADAKYNGLVRNEPDQVLADPAEGATPLVLWHNAQIPWAVGSYRFDASGIPACRRLLVHGGKLVTYWSNSRYSQYLKLRPTGDAANLEVHPGVYEPASLLKHGSRPLYHLHEFSYFEPNTITGEFSAEIRAGEEIGPEGSRPIKGGSVSGSTARAVSSARFSSVLEQRERYFGPDHIRCADLTLAGN